MGRIFLVAIVGCALLGICCTAYAESASVLLEKGIYTEETVGDLDAAIEIYEQIVADAEANRAYVAQAQYRLGMCYLKKGQKQEAREAFEKLIAQFREQKELVAEAQKHLPSELELDPAPWADREEMRLRLVSMAGAQIGTLIWTAESVTAAEKPAWRVQSYMVISLTAQQQFTSVDAERTSFAPITGRTKNSLGDFRAVYGPNSVELTTSAKGKETTRQISINRLAYDNEQALYLIRRLPLAEGYRASFPIFPVTGGSIVECRIEVTKKEKVSVPAGEFECYATNLAVYSGAAKALEHQLWFSADEHQYLVKYDSGAAVMELTGVSVKKEDEPVKIHSGDLGISMTAPSGWNYCWASSAGRYKFMLYLLPPELEAWALLTGSEVGSLTISARQVAEGDAAALKGFFKGYTIRPESWSELEISGMPAASYAADYQHEGKDMVEYRTYMLGKSTVYWFVFRIEKENFEAKKAAFDAIVTSFKAAKERGEEATRAKKKASESFASKGWKLWGQRNLSEAENMFWKAAQKDPTNANAWNGLGWSQLNQGKREAAKESFEKCLEVEPKHAAALNGLGWIAKGQGKTDEAIGYWEKAVEASPSATAALSGLATTYMESGQPEKGAKYYQMWLKLEPKNADAKAGLERARGESGQSRGPKG